MKVNVWDALVFPVDPFGSGIDSVFQYLAISMLALFMQNLFTFCVGSSKCLMFFNHVLCLFSWSNVFWALARVHCCASELWGKNGVDIPMPMEIYVTEGICIAAMLVLVVELLCSDFVSKEIVVRRSHGGYSVRQMSGGYMRARSEVQLDAESHNACDWRSSE
ncbi:hypothetical protein AAVH_11693 [Aphelenchoides avenae]|nr:hypothetical protein AAVH_11693 [Aphelenchus avenae]